MKKEANVADGERGDLADFLVTEVALELQINHFPLVLGQFFQQAKNLANRFSSFDVGFDADLYVLKRGQPGLPFPRVEGEVAADRK